MKCPVGNIDHHPVSRGSQKRLAFDVSLLIKQDQAHFPPEDDQRFILLLPQMPVRLDVRIRFHGVEQAMADRFIGVVKIVVDPLSGDCCA